MCSVFMCQRLPMVTACSAIQIEEEEEQKIPIVA